LNGVQSTSAPPGFFTVCSPSHVAPVVAHAPFAAHANPTAQSALLAQRALHVLDPSHAVLFGHAFAVDSSRVQLPLPSHLLVASLPSTQLEPHVIAPFGNEHVARVTPSHVAPHVPEPAHATRDPCGIPVTAVHVPAILSHASHCPVHAESQQNPSTQCALAQLEDAEHDVPFVALHTPVASHVLMPVHVSGSDAFITATHAPVPETHVMHVPLHAPEQQTPSSHTLERQSPPSVHELPAATSPKISAVERLPLPPLLPPAMSTLPEASSVPVGLC
jgi:hypothetical protein